MSTHLNYQDALSFLEKNRHGLTQTIDKAIEALKHLIAIQGLVGTSYNIPNQINERFKNPSFETSRSELANKGLLDNIHYGDIRNLSIGNATEKILETDGQPKTNKELVEILKKLGKEVSENTLQATLHLKKHPDGPFIRKDNKWGLAKWENK